MWEIFNLCELDPYPTVTNQEFKSYKEKVFRGEEELEVPKHGPSEM